MPSSLVSYYGMFLLYTLMEVTAGATDKFHDKFHVFLGHCWKLAFSRPDFFLYGAFFLYELVQSDSDFVFVNCRVALATKENLQSQRGVLHGVTSRLSTVTSILLTIQLEHFFTTSKPDWNWKTKRHFPLWIRILILSFRLPLFSRWWLVGGMWPLDWCSKKIRRQLVPSYTTD